MRIAVQRRLDGNVARDDTRFREPRDEGLRVLEARILPRRTFAGQCTSRAFVSGPRSVSVVVPWSFVTTISQWLDATERKSPDWSL